MKQTMLRLVRNAPGLLVAFGLSIGCGKPVQDDFRSEGGMAPDPAGVIEGSVLYMGPKPTCVYERGKAVRVKGRVILTMFRFDNPPPPEGTATTAENLLVIAGEQLFGKEDCLAKGAEIDLSERIMRNVQFRWPQIELTAEARAFQIRGFYDYDEDMNPFFSVKNLPTAGDIAGAAIVSLQDPSAGFLKIEMPARGKAHNDGYLKTGVTVALANHVWMERPAFKLAKGNWNLSSEATLPVTIDRTIFAPDTHRTLKLAWEQTCATPGEEGCGFALESLSEEHDGPLLEAAGVELDFNPLRYAFVVQPVDIKTVVPDGPDLPKADGVPDPHPLLGASLPVPFTFPAVIMQRRAQTPEQGVLEKAAGIPAVTLLGTSLPGEIETKKVFLDKMNIAVPAIAVVDLVANNTACRIPYLPPGSAANSYEDRISACAELPTGVYGVNVLHGVAGGVPSAVDESISDNGQVITGGGLSGQAWTLPNQLADPLQVGAENVLSHQGTDGLFVVHDPNPEDTTSCDQAWDPVFESLRDVTYKKVCRADEDPLSQSAGLYGTLKGVDGSGCLPEACCEAVEHLCGLPLCETVDVRGLKVRASPTKLTERKFGGEMRSVPNCVPFPMPALCCPGAGDIN